MPNQHVLIVLVVGVFMHNNGGQGLVSKTLTPKQAARRAEITKELNPVRKTKKLTSKKKAK
jgi:hypothetical protein